jgi:hypothetical protein
MGEQSGFDFRLKVQRNGHGGLGFQFNVDSTLPNLVALELSSFKCGHDTPIYSVVEEIVGHSGTPYVSSFRHRA